jgi:hypothetical protein
MCTRGYRWLNCRLTGCDQALDDCGAHEPRPRLELDLACIDVLAEPQHRVVGVPCRSAYQAEQAVADAFGEGLPKHLGTRQLREAG